jgi:hypothetical protein
MPLMDFEGMSDLFVKIKFEDKEKQTDVHYRSTTGVGNFNWRVLLDVELPCKIPEIIF